MRLSLGLTLAVGLLRTALSEIGAPNGVFYALAVFAFLSLPGAFGALLRLHRLDEWESGRRAG